MRSFVIFYKSSLVYLVGVWVGTDASGGPVLLATVGVLYTELASLFRSLCVTELR